MEAVVPLDWQRMLFGAQPPLFYVEIVVRTCVIYAYALLLLRWLGGRAIGQLSTVEFLLVIALGSAVGDAMFYPDVPLLHALAVVTLVVAANKVLDVVIARSRRAERAIDGKPRRVIENGVIDAGLLERNEIGTAEIFQLLRHKGIRQLGEVADAFLEPDGTMSVFRADPPRPGLPIVPPRELANPTVVRAGSHAEGRITLACERCGTVAARHTGELVSDCATCGHDKWVEAASPHAS